MFVCLFSRIGLEKALNNGFGTHPHLGPFKFSKTIGRHLAWKVGLWVCGNPETGQQRSSTQSFSENLLTRAGKTLVIKLLLEFVTQLFLWKVRTITSLQRWGKLCGSTHDDNTNIPSWEDPFSEARGVEDSNLSSSLWFLARPLNVQGMYLTQQGLFVHLSPNSHAAIVAILSVPRAVAFLAQPAAPPLTFIKRNRTHCLMSRSGDGEAPLRRFVDLFYIIGNWWGSELALRCSVRWAWPEAPSKEGTLPADHPFCCWDVKVFSCVRFLALFSICRILSIKSGDRVFISFSFTFGLSLHVYLQAGFSTTDADMDALESASKNYRDRRGSGHCELLRRCSAKAKSGLECWSKSAKAKLQSGVWQALRFQYHLLKFRGIWKQPELDGSWKNVWKMLSNCRRPPSIYYVSSCFEFLDVVRNIIPAAVCIHHFWGKSWSTVFEFVLLKRTNSTLCYVLQQ